MIKHFTLTLLLLFSSPSFSQGEPENGTIEITNVWSRPTGGRTMSAVLYLALTNKMTGADKLIAIDTPIAEIAEMHSTVHSNNIVLMRAVDFITLEPGVRFEFKTGGHHIMLMKLHQPLALGARFPVTLTFENAGKITVYSTIRKRAPSQ